MLLKRCLPAIAIITLVLSCSVKENVSMRPNILFIMSDDHAYQAISAYDETLIQTPNIDRLADEGMIFTNACVANSICAPSRATILTGKHSHLNGKIDNIKPFDTTQVTFPQLFQNAGYQTAMYGKLHFGNNPKGVDDFMILPGQGKYINPRFIMPDGDTIITGYVTDIITDLTIGWLKEKRDPEKPFLMMYLHKAPHRPWWPSPDKFKEFASKTFPEPASLFDDYSNRGTAARTAEMNILNHMMYGHDMKLYPETVEALGKVEPNVPELNDFHKYSSYARGNDEQKSKYKPTLDSINNWFIDNWPSMNNEEKMKWKYQRYMQDYLGCISSVDENVGRVLEYLDESGLAENTIVVYTSDQGFYLGEHGWFDKRFIYNESFKTPLLVRWPNTIKPGTTSEEMVQNLDFAQTFLEIAGIPAPEDMQGESIVPLLRGEHENWNREAVYYHYYEYPAVHMVKRHYGIATPKYKLAHFYYDVDEWEFYDLEEDPNEMRNEYDNPSYQEVILELKNKLKELRIYYKDTNESQFLPEKPITVNSKGKGGTVTLKYPYAEKYNGGGPNALTDGIRGPKGKYSSIDNSPWQGFEKDDLVAVIELMGDTEFNHISAGFLHNINKWVFAPEKVEFFASQDGSDYSLIGAVERSISINTENPTRVVYEVDTTHIKARYLIVQAKNIGNCPEWHIGAGNPAWLFADEVIIK